MSREAELKKLRHVYSGWVPQHELAKLDAKYGSPAGSPAPAAQLDLVSEIERLKAELADAKAPKKSKAKLEVVE